MNNLEQLNAEYKALVRDWMEWLDHSSSRSPLADAIWEAWKPINLWPEKVHQSPHVGIALVDAALKHPEAPRSLIERSIEGLEAYVSYLGDLPGGGRDRQWELQILCERISELRAAAC